MDVFDYRSSRVIAKDGIFEIGDAPVSDISGMFMRLKNLMVSEIHTQWDILFLAQYVTDSMVPRSLRWEVSPQKGETDFQDWFQFFNEAGGKLLQFLIKKKNDKLARLDGEIKIIKEKLSPFKDSEEYKEKSMNLRKILEKEETEQKIKKKKKFCRDVGDYKAGSVFVWQSKIAAETSEVTGCPSAPGGEEMSVESEGYQRRPPSTQTQQPSASRRASHRSPVRQGKPPQPKPRSRPQKETGKNHKKGPKNHKPSEYNQHNQEYHSQGFGDFPYSYDSPRRAYTDDYPSRYPISTQNRFQSLRDEGYRHDNYDHHGYRADYHSGPRTPGRGSQNDRPYWHQPPPSQIREGGGWQSPYRQRQGQYPQPQHWGFPRAHQNHLGPIEKREESEGGGNQGAKRKRV